MGSRWPAHYAGRAWVGVGVGLLGVAGWLLFGVRLSRDVAGRSDTHLLQVVSGTFAGPPDFLGSAPDTVFGVTLQGSGPFIALAYVAELRIVEAGSVFVVPWDDSSSAPPTTVAGPVDVWVAPSGQGTPVANILAVGQPQGFAVSGLGPRPAQGIPRTSAPALRPTNPIHPTVSFALPEDCRFMVAFAEAPIAPGSVDLVPKEFKIRNLDATELRPGQALAGRAARTAIVSYTPPTPAQVARFGQSAVMLNVQESLLRLNDLDVGLGQLVPGALLPKQFPGSRALSMGVSGPRREIAVLPDPSPDRFAFALSPADSIGPAYIGLVGGAKRLTLQGPLLDIALGTAHYTFHELDRVSLTGRLGFSLEWLAPDVPHLRVSGHVTSCRANGVELVPRPWDLIPAEIRGSLAGSFIGGLVGWLLGFWKGRTVGSRALPG